MGRYVGWWCCVFLCFWCCLFCRWCGPPHGVVDVGGSNDVVVVCFCGVCIWVVCCSVFCCDTLPPADELVVGVLSRVLVVIWGVCVFCVVGCVVSWFSFVIELWC